MREIRVRAARLRPVQLLLELSLVGACVAACASGCATQADTIDPGDQTVAGAGGTDIPVSGTGGKPSSSGGGSAMAGASGGQVVSAFGGTGSSGGKASAGAANGGGSGGAAGSGGKAQGGSGGSAQAGAAGGGGKNGGAGSGGTPSGGASGGTAGASSLTCLASWKNDKCDTCSSQTQSDKLGCVEILDCYYQNSCGPTTCSGNTQKCGANTVGKGTAGYPIASDVYTCLCQ